MMIKSERTPPPIEVEQCLAKSIAGMEKKRREEFIEMMKKHQKPEFVEKILNMARDEWRKAKARGESTTPTGSNTGDRENEA